jgi:hypothetical protein
MGMHHWFVVAQWDRPLGEIVSRYPSEPADWDHDLSWSREDGWQCFAPSVIYEDWLLEQVEQIEGETGGPVLVMEVVDSDSWCVAFIEGGRVRHVGYEPDTYDTFEEFCQEMVDAWGEDWIAGAAGSLQRWARPIVEVSSQSLQLAMAAPWLRVEGALFDLLRLFTLVEHPDEPVWWAAIPDVDYAVWGQGLYVPGVAAPEEDARGGDLALTAGPDGFGVWSVERKEWASQPVTNLTAFLAALPELLRELGWTVRPLDDDDD